MLDPRQRSPLSLKIFRSVYFSKYISLELDAKEILLKPTKEINKHFYLFLLNKQQNRVDQIKFTKQPSGTNEN